MTKEQKRQFQAERNKQLIVTSKDFRERYVGHIASSTSRLLDLALTMGSKPETGGVLASQEVNDIGKIFEGLRKELMREIRNLPKHYSALYRVAGKRAENARLGEAGQRREGIMHRAVIQFKPEMYHFIKAAAHANEALADAAHCVTFKKGDPLEGYMSPTYASEFLLAYVAAQRRQNKENGQYISPDHLMNQHLGAGIRHVVKRFAETCSKSKSEKVRKLPELYPDQFNFCSLRGIVSYYTVKPEANTAEDRAVQALRTNQSLWPVLQREYETLCTARKAAYDRYHAENPRPDRDGKPATKKGEPRPARTEAEKTAAKLKRQATRASKELGYELRKLSAPAKPAAEVPVKAQA
jgi:hypothetical protein